MTCSAALERLDETKSHGIQAIGVLLAPRIEYRPGACPDITHEASMLPPTASGWAKFPLAGFGPAPRRRRLNLRAALNRTLLQIPRRPADPRRSTHGSQSTRARLTAPSCRRIAGC